MVELIKEIKDQLLEQVDAEIKERGGVERVDPDTIDMIKDLAEAEKACWEAEYYRSVTEAMDNNSGYQTNGMSYGRNGYKNRRGWQNQYGSGYMRSGYNTMGHDESIEGIRNIMMTANPDEKERLKAELRNMMNM